MIYQLQNKGFERASRKKWFYIFFGLLTIVCTGLFLYELRTILLPVLVGAMLAYLFRPVKKWVQVRWLPHELSVLFAFGIAAMVVYGGVIRVKQMIPDEKEKLELKVRLKYKLNERYSQVFDKPNPVMMTIQKEINPLVTNMNDYLTLSQDEVDLFRKYRRGYRGEPPISDRYYDYFKKSLQLQEQEAELPANGKELKEEGPHTEKAGWIESMSIWILTPLIFIFLIFDNGQIRTSLMSLIPNRYFEMTLTMIDELDEAIGKYLRGTFLECSLVGGTMGFGLFLLGFPVSVAILVAVVSGLSNAIPFLGTAIGLVISIAYALVAEDTVPMIPGLSPEGLPIYVAILVGITHVLDNVVYSPVVLGGAVNLHPMVIIIAITSGSILMGFWGMLLAIPTVVIVKTGVETLFKELKSYRII